MPGPRRDFELPGGRVAALEALPAAPPAALPAAGRRGTALLVPGFTGSKEDFAPVLPRLAAAGFRAVAIDLPGQYESPGPDTPQAYGAQELGRVVLAVAAHLGEGTLHLVGHSFGGLVGRAAALTAPGRFASLALLASGPAALTGPRAARMRALEPVLAAGGMAAVHAAMERLAAAEPGAVDLPPAMRAFLRTRFLASSPHGLAGMGASLQTEPDRVAELRSTGIPVLVAYGDADDAWPPAVQAEMARRLGARREVVAGAAHSPAVEAPAQTAEILTQFWRAVEDHRGAVSP